MRHAVLLVGCYGITTLVVNDADNIISLKCFTPVWYCIVLLCTPGAPTVGDIVPHTSGVRGRAPTAQRFSTIFSTQDGLYGHYNIVNIVDYDAAIGDKTACPPPPCVRPCWNGHKTAICNCAVELT